MIPILISNKYHWVWSCTSFLYQVKVNFIRKRNFAFFYQHTSCYILVPLLLVSSPFLLIRWFFITRLFLVPLLLVFFHLSSSQGGFSLRGEEARDPELELPACGESENVVFQFLSFRVFVFLVFPCVCVLDLPEPEGHLLNGSSLDQSGKRPGNPGVPAAGRSAGKSQLLQNAFLKFATESPFFFTAMLHAFEMLALPLNVC